MWIKMKTGGYAAENSIGEFRVKENAQLDAALTNNFTSIRVSYDVILTPQEADAYDNPATLPVLTNAILAVIPPAVFGRAVSSWSIPERIVKQLYNIEVTYASEISDDIWNIEFVGNSETLHIIKDKTTISSHGIYVGNQQLEPPDLGGLIGVQDGSVTGADIISAVATYSMTTSIPRLVVTDAGMQAVAETIVSKIGYTNESEFRGFAPESMLMVGGSGVSRNGNVYEIRLNFDFRPGETLEIGSGSKKIEIEKAGHQLLSILTRTIEKTNATLDEDKFTVSEPLAYYVHRVYETTDFQDIVDAVENLWTFNA